MTTGAIIIRLEQARTRRRRVRNQIPSEKTFRAGVVTAVVWVTSHQRRAVLLDRRGHRLEQGVVGGSSGPGVSSTRGCRQTDTRP